MVLALQLLAGAGIWCAVSVPIGIVIGKSLAGRDDPETVALDMQELAAPEAQETSAV